MPERTNDFQELVAFIQQALAPAGAQISQSVEELADDGDTREIDVLIDTTVGEYRIKIAVEAKDENRKMDLTTFGSITAKYSLPGGVNVNKLVLVTRAGFTKRVRKHAKRQDIALFTLTEAQHFDWTLFRPPGPAFQTRLTLDDVHVYPEVSQDALDFGVVVCECGRCHGSLEKYAAHIFWTRAVTQCHDTLVELDTRAAASNTDTFATVEFEQPEHHHAQLLLGSQQFPIDKCKSTVRCHVGTPEPPTRLTVTGRPFICTAEVLPAIPNCDPLDVFKHARVECSCCGKDHGTVEEWATTTLIRQLLPRRPTLLANLQLAAAKRGVGHLTVDFPLGTDDVPAFRNLRVRYGDTTHRVKHIRPTAHVSSDSSPLTCTQYELTNTHDGATKTVSDLQAHLGDLNFRFLFPEGCSPKKALMQVSRPKLAAKKNSRLKHKRKRPRKPED